MAISSGLGVAGAVPVGVVNPFAGATAPSGWLLCFGQAVSRSQYSALFAVLNTTYGAGDGSTTFTLPDMRGRAVAGKDDMGGSAAGRLTSTVLSASNTLGATGGTQTHLLTGAQSGTRPHTHTASSGNDSPDHSHGYTGPTGAVGVAGGGVLVSSMSGTSTGGASARHTHSVTVNSSTSDNAGSAHLNTQPTIVLNYIIKAQ